LQRRHRTAPYRKTDPPPRPYDSDPIASQFAQPLVPFASRAGDGVLLGGLEETATGPGGATCSPPWSGAAMSGLEVVKQRSACEGPDLDARLGPTHTASARARRGCNHSNASDRASGPPRSGARMRQPTAGARTADTATQPRDGPTWFKTPWADGANLRDRRSPPCPAHPAGRSGKAAAQGLVATAASSWEVELGVGPECAGEQSSSSLERQGRARSSPSAPAGGSSDASNVQQSDSDASPAGSTRGAACTRKRGIMISDSDVESDGRRRSQRRRRLRDPKAKSWPFDDTDSGSPAEGPGSMAGMPGPIDHLLAFPWRDEAGGNTAAAGEAQGLNAGQSLDLALDQADFRLKAERVARSESRRPPTSRHQLVQAPPPSAEQLEHTNLGLTTFSARSGGRAFRRRTLPRYED
jgi:hypothetical protein